MLQREFECAEGLNLADDEQLVAEVGVQERVSRPIESVRHWFGDGWRQTESGKRGVMVGQREPTRNTIFDDALSCEPRIRLQNLVERFEGHI